MRACVRVCGKLFFFRSNPTDNSQAGGGEGEAAVGGGVVGDGIAIYKDVWAYINGNINEYSHTT